MAQPPISAQTILRHCFAAALNAVEPERATTLALAGASVPARPVALVAAGKAAAGMADGLVAWLAGHDLQPVAGLIVTPTEATSPHPALRSLVGDHPLPGANSLAAGTALSEWVSELPSNVEVHVAISGGASSLLAAPLPGLSMEDVIRTFELLLDSGLDIVESNAIRKRVVRWSAGRLAMALHPRSVTTWLLSDVPGDDPGVIGSGPCHGDRWSSRDVVALCRSAGLMGALPSAVIAALEFETPKPSHAAANAERTAIVASNRVAMEAARSCAIALGCQAKLMTKPLRGEARQAGRQIAKSLLKVRRSRFGVVDTLGESVRPRVFVYGGETTVTLGAEHGEGGRSMELALAAAAELAGKSPGVALLAAGTDGRDGPTDAAGAMVDPSTWQAIAEGNVDPSEALARHDSYRALDAAGALLRTGVSGTNVMDLVLALSQPGS